MGMWGTWEWKEDSQLLMSTLRKFQPPSPRKVKLGRGRTVSLG